MYFNQSVTVDTEAFSFGQSKTIRGREAPRDQVFLTNQNRPLISISLARDAARKTHIHLTT